MALIGVSMMLSSCEGKKKKDVPVVETELVAENTISADKEYMFLNYGKDYRWFETTVVMNEFLDEADKFSVQSVTSVFQSVIEDGSAMDVKIVTSIYNADNHDIVVYDGFWVEDIALNNEAIYISFEDAYKCALESNLPKPHSRYCVLRKEVGPSDANPQYVFGNGMTGMLFVDAVTGDVSDTNPFFPDSEE